MKTKKLLVFGSRVVHKARDNIKNVTASDVAKAARIAVSVARKSIRKSGGRKNIQTPRIIPIPKTGSIIPLIPLFAELMALESFADGAAGVAKIITEVEKGRRELEEATHHTKIIEFIEL